MATEQPEAVSTIDSLSIQLHSTQPLEVTADPALRSPFQSQFLNAYRQSYPEAPERHAFFQAVLDLIDQQGVDNLTTFSPEQGVTLVYTRISVNKLVNTLRQSSVPIASSDNEETPRQATYIFGGLAPYPDGHPFYYWDMVYDEVRRQITHMLHAQQRGETVPQSDIYITSASSASSALGTISQAWLHRVQREGLSLYGNVFADFIRAHTPSSTKSVTIRGHSMGGAIAIEVAKALNARFDTRIGEATIGQASIPLKVHVTNAPNINNSSLRSRAGAIIGFGIQYLYESRTNPKWKDWEIHARDFNESLQRRLALEGKVKTDNRSDRRRKRRAMRIHGSTTAKGTMTDGVKAYHLTGERDLTLALRRPIRNPQQRDVFSAAIGHAHWIDWSNTKRINQWNHLLSTFTELSD